MYIKKNSIFQKLSGINKGHRQKPSAQRKPRRRVQANRLISVPPVMRQFL